MAQSISMLASPNPMLAQQTHPTISESKNGQDPTPMGVVTDTGNGQTAASEPERKAAKSGVPTAAELPTKANTSKQRASAVDAASVKANKKNQVAVINSTLTRIEEWFGQIAVTQTNGGRVVMLMPKGLVYCQHCKRLRLPESMLADGHCEYEIGENSNAVNAVTGETV